MVDRFFIGFILRRGGVLHGSDPADADELSGGFATPELQPILGLANFLNLAGWLMLAFGVMFQAPIAVLLAVRSARFPQSR